MDNNTSDKIPVHLRISTIIKFSHNGLWIDIFRYLSLKDMIKLREVNNKLKQIIKNTIHCYLSFQQQKKQNLLQQIDDLKLLLSEKAIDLLYERTNDIKQLDILLSDQLLVGKDIFDIMKYPRPPQAFQQVITAFYYLIHTRSEIQKSKEITWNTCKTAMSDTKIKIRMKALTKDTIKGDYLNQIEELIHNLTSEQVDIVNKQLVKIFDLVLVAKDYLKSSELLKTDQNARKFIELIAHNRHVSFVITLMEANLMNSPRKKLYIMNSELCSNIFEYLPIESIFHMRLVNKKFKSNIEEAMPSIVNSKRILLERISKKKNDIYENFDQSVRDKLSYHQHPTTNIDMQSFRFLNTLSNPPAIAILAILALAYLIYSPVELANIKTGSGFVGRVLGQREAFLNRIYNQDIEKIDKIHVLKFDQLIEENHLSVDKIKPVSFDCVGFFELAMEIREIRRDKDMLSQVKAKDYFRLLKEEKKLVAFIKNWGK